ncbi:MAG: peptidoglycan DD-metalloendopeptidase family protein [Bacteroidetes bacterium]|nr:peptidoglycan DD-metalloendopeptidase family protein [Bacteroidota bacterium]
MKTQLTVPKAWMPIDFGRWSMKKIAQVSLCILFSLISFVHADAQSTQKKKVQLQSQMKKLQEEIKLINADMKRTSAKKVKSLSEIQALQAKIRSREKLIQNLGGQINEMDEEINLMESELVEKATEVEKMKQDYAEMLRKSYENITLQNQVVFLLSSATFYEAARRYNYLLRIADYRRGQAKELQLAIEDLQSRHDTLALSKEEKQTILGQQTHQKVRMEQEKQEKDQAVVMLQEKEKTLRKRIEQKNKAAQALNNKIQKIIEEEIRLARKKAEDEEKRRREQDAKKGIVRKAPTLITLTPEEQELSKGFSNNRGKLPWPVLKGYVISSFGKHEHAVLKGVMVENNGIDIKTERGAEARALFGGTVVSVFYLPTTQNCIIIKHGEYFTVYSNIETVSVKPNQTVDIKQSLGKLYTDSSEDVTKVHLEIWKGKDKLDPDVWLAGR